MPAAEARNGSRAHPGKSGARSCRRWLPGLTNQIGEIVAAQLREHRLAPESPVETFSTPRRLTVRVVRIPERQTDLEELVNGPPVSASFKPDGSPTQAAAGFAAKQGVEVSALERLQTPKGEYLAFRQAQRGKPPSTSCLPARGNAPRHRLSEVDALGCDARNPRRAPLGRPIRWLLFIYGGRVVPSPSPAARRRRRQSDVATGAVTYGHRFLTTAPAGRAIKVRSSTVRARLLENFVILAQRGHNTRSRASSTRRRSGCRARQPDHAHEAGLLLEVPAWSSTRRSRRHLRAGVSELPDEGADTTLISPAIFSGRGRGRKAEETRFSPSSTPRRTTSARSPATPSASSPRGLRDARLLLGADRKVPLESRVGRLGTCCSTRSSGRTRRNSGGIGRLAEGLRGRASAPTRQRRSRPARRRAWPRPI